MRMRKKGKSANVWNTRSGKKVSKLRIVLLETL